ncbi:MAG: hypothetical protein ACFFD6_09730, partial [Candidatus Thorarchaeota archaeon]
MIIAAAIATVVEALLLIVIAWKSKSEWAFWLDRASKLLLMTDLVMGCGVFAFYYIIYLTLAWILTFFIFILGGLLLLSHLWRIHQNLFRDGNIFLRSRTLVIMNIIKLCLYLGAFSFGGYLILLRVDTSVVFSF